jgi:inorganic pyrophosphatase
MMRVYNCVFTMILFCLASCGVKDYGSLPLYSQDHMIQAVVEAPAGTDYPVNYNLDTDRFEVELEKDTLGNLETIPNPCNIGFIPSTLVSEGNQHDNEAIEVLILAEPLETGDVIEIQPVGMVTIRINEQPGHLIVAVPCDKEYQTINAGNLAELNSKYPEIFTILGDWIRSSDPEHTAQVVSWQDEMMAVKFIETWAVN